MTFTDAAGNIVNVQEDATRIIAKRGVECPDCNVIAFLLVNRYGRTTCAKCDKGPILTGEVCE